MPSGDMERDRYLSVLPLLLLAGAAAATAAAAAKLVVASVRADARAPENEATEEDGAMDLRAEETAAPIPVELVFVGQRRAAFCAGVIIATAASTVIEGAMASPGAEG